MHLPIFGVDSARGNLNTEIWIVELKNTILLYYETQVLSTPRNIKNVSALHIISINVKNTKHSAEGTYNKYKPMSGSY